MSLTPFQEFEWAPEKERFYTNCHVCVIKFWLPAKELKRLSRADNSGERPGYCCPCGHRAQFTDAGAKRAMEWLGENHPDILNPKPKVLVPSTKLKVDVKAKVESDAEYEKRLAEKIKEIDDFLARRGKYAPEV